MNKINKTALGKFVKITDNRNNLAIHIGKTYEVYKIVRQGLSREANDSLGSLAVIENGKLCMLKNIGYEYV